MLVALLFVRLSIEAISPYLFGDPPAYTNAALILYVLEHDVQCRLEQSVLPTGGSTIDISKIPRHIFEHRDTTFLWLCADITTCRRNLSSLLEVSNSLVFRSRLIEY